VGGAQTRDPQNFVRFNTTDMSELVTTGSRRVIFWTWDHGQVWARVFTRKRQHAIPHSDCLLAKPSHERIEHNMDHPSMD